MASLRIALARSLCIGLSLSAIGCYPSNVLEDHDRAVLLQVEPHEWRDVDPDRFAGAYASTSISGPAAASLVEVRYVFVAEEDAGVGRYTGAGLVAGEDGLHYQTLDGTWRLERGSLVLDGGPEIEVGAADDHLRLASDGGVVVLRRFELE